MKINGRLERSIEQTQSDLEEGLRQEGVLSPEQVLEARLERGGAVSVVRRDRQSHVAEVKLEGGVQVIRIEISESKFDSVGGG